MLINKGSEWNKWDLHYHVIGTHMNNRYSITEDEFLESLETSDIQVYGLTDYFTADAQLNLIEKFNKRYPDSIKRFLVNVEFRLNQNVSSESNGQVNVHLIFDPESSHDKIIAFEKSLPTIQTRTDGTHIKVIDLQSEQDFASATIDFETLKAKLNETYGLEHPYLLVFPANGHGGLRSTDVGGALRNQYISQELDKQADFFFAGKQSRNYYLNLDDDGKTPRSRYEGSIAKAMILGSDYHGENSQRQLDHFSWVKGRTDFAGLKQITYEPSERVSLNLEKPDEKAPYQVIDKVMFSENGSKGIFSKTVEFNPNLNSIIGGRSNGKSTLTNSIARTLGSERFNNYGSESGNGLYYLENAGMTVHWLDGSTDVNRDIEFLPQDYMIKIAENETERTKLIRRIIRSSDIDDHEIDEYRKNVQNSLNNISALLSKRTELISELENLVAPEGDQAGITQEVERLEARIKEQTGSDEGDSDKILSTYRKAENELQSKVDAQKKAEIKIRILEKNEHNKFGLLEKIEPTGDSELDEDLTAQANSILTDANNAWQKVVQDHITAESKVTEQLKAIVEKIRQSPAYSDGKTWISAHKVLDDLNVKLSVENGNLKKVQIFEENTKKLKDRIAAVEFKIMDEFKSTLKFRENLQNNFDAKSEGIEIRIVFQQDGFEDKISYLNSRSTINNNFIDEFNRNLYRTATDVFHRSDLTFNQGKTLEDLISDIFRRDWFTMSYELVYDNDAFSSMSQGKKAFVILTLMLEFSNDKKPVIIDQPEDSLDNRSIYKDLTKYLKTKKRERQIILVTHNPNVVVGADSENVIIANQDAPDTPNICDVKFDYVNGPLEDSFPKTKNKHPLYNQGIREQVIEILEGGKQAFSIREHKYHLN